MKLRLSPTSIAVLWAAILLAAPCLVQAQAVPACRQKMWTEARAVAGDLMDIRNQLSREAHEALVEQFAESVEPLFSELNEVSQAALERFVTSLRDVPADDPENPGAVARLKLANGLHGLLVSAAAGNEEIRQVLTKLTTVYQAAEGVSIVSLDLNLKTLLASARSCRG